MEIFSGPLDQTLIDDIYNVRVEESLLTFTEADHDGGCSCSLKQLFSPYVPAPPPMEWNGMEHRAWTLGFFACR